jgi:hypothetical protein
MTIYNVHIYREMRLAFGGIEAATPEAAAATARDKPTEEADSIEDCNGDDLAALVDEAGDEEYERSLTIAFEPERRRKAASRLLAALEAVLPYAEGEGESLYERWKRDGDLQIKDASDRCGRALDQARAAIAGAKAIGVLPDPAPIDMHALLATRRQIALIWSVEDVQWVRPDLTDDQAWEVLQYAGRRHDAEIGMNWDVLHCFADLLHPDVPESHAACGGSDE